MKHPDLKCETVLLRAVTHMSHPAVVCTPDQPQSTVQPGSPATQGCSTGSAAGTCCTHSAARCMYEAQGSPPHNKQETPAFGHPHKATAPPHTTGVIRYSGFVPPVHAQPAAVLCSWLLPAAGARPAMAPLLALAAPNPSLLPAGVLDTGCQLTVTSSPQLPSIAWRCSHAHSNTCMWCQGATHTHSCRPPSAAPFTAAPRPCP